MSEDPAPKPIIPVATELEEWRPRVEAGDEVARRAVEDGDPAAIAELRVEFAASRALGY